MAASLQPFDQSTSSLARQGFGRGLAKQVQKSTDLVIGRGEVAVTTDNVRAALTFSALTNVGTLVGTASQLMQTAPEGAAYYEACISAYAIGAANSIARFQ